MSSVRGLVKKDYPLDFGTTFETMIESPTTVRGTFGRYHYFASEDAAKSLLRSAQQILKAGYNQAELDPETHRESISSVDSIGIEDSPKGLLRSGNYGDYKWRIFLTAEHIGMLDMVGAAIVASQNPEPLAPPVRVAQEEKKAVPASVAVAPGADEESIDWDKYFTMRESVRLAYQAYIQAAFSEEKEHKSSLECRKGFESFKGQFFCLNGKSGEVAAKTKEFKKPEHLYQPQKARKS